MNEAMHLDTVRGPLMMGHSIISKHGPASRAEYKVHIKQDIYFHNLL